MVYQNWQYGIPHNFNIKFLLSGGSFSKLSKNKLMPLFFFYRVFKDFL